MCRCWASLVANLLPAFMLKKNQTTQPTAVGGRYVIVASQYNAVYVDGLVKFAKRTLKQAGARKIEIVRVPGAFEIPVVANRFAALDHSRPDAILCLGVIIQGATAHANHIGGAITNALMDIQLKHGVPCIHEVLLVENEDQAQARCLDPRTNRGVEAAQTAMAMAGILGGFPDDLPF